MELGHRWVQPRQEAGVQEGRREGNVWATLWQNWRQDPAVQDADFRVLGGQGSISRGSWGAAWPRDWSSGPGKGCTEWGGALPQPTCRLQDLLHPLPYLPELLALATASAKMWA